MSTYSYFCSAHRKTQRIMGTDYNACAQIPTEVFEAMKPRNQQAMLNSGLVIRKEVVERVRVVKTKVKTKAKITKKPKIVKEAA